jgi:6-phosphogluconolactonase
MVEHFAEPEALAHAAADVFVREAAGKERFVVALSGGSTPVRMYRHLAGAPVDWSGLHIFWSDDRFVPPDHPDSNEGSARKEFLSKVPIPNEQVHGIYNNTDPATCALKYERLIESVGEPLDLLILGMGDDGHTASLFPGDPSVEESERLVVPSTAPAGIKQRITFTLPLITRFSTVLILVAGRSKRQAWESAISGDASPIGRVLRARPDAICLLHLID